jgi:hypothetical protein
LFANADAIIIQSPRDIEPAINDQGDRKNFFAGNNQVWPVNMPATKLPCEPCNFTYDIDNRPGVEQITDTNGYPSKKDPLSGGKLWVEARTIPLFDRVGEKGKYPDKDY